LVDLQLDAQNSYLFTYNTFIKILFFLCKNIDGFRPVVEVLNVWVVFVEGDLVSCSGGRDFNKCIICK